MNFIDVSFSSTAVEWRYESRKKLTALDTLIVVESLKINLMFWLN
jgi:hypothetical protein